MRIVVGFVLVALGCAAPASGPLPPLELSCDGELGSLREVYASDALFEASVGPCGELLRFDERELLRLDRGAGEWEPLAPVSGGPSSWSRDGRALLVQGADLVVWRDTSVGALVQVPVNPGAAAGFLRVGGEERAWVCSEGELGPLSADGWERLVEVRVCGRVRASEAGPRLLYETADRALAVYDVARGVTLDLSEVPYEALDDDQVGLSRDGRFLFHRPSRTSTPRIAVFDLERPEGERLVGAPATEEVVARIVHAAAAGHTAAWPGDDGSVIALAPSGELQRYEGASLLGVAPEGDRVLLGRTTAGEASAELVVVDLETGRSRAVGATTREISSRQTSADGRALVTRSSSDGASQSRLLVFLWDDERVASERSVQLPLERPPTWVGSDGATLIQGTAEGVVLRGPDGAERRRWDDARRAFTWDIHGGRVLLRLTRAEDSHALLLLDGDRVESLYEGPELRSVSVDPSGRHVAFIEADDGTRRLHAGDVP